jgi:hypothetical protein
VWNVFDVMIRRMEIWETKLVGEALGVGNATNCVPLISVIIRSMRGDVKGYNQLSVAGYQIGSFVSAKYDFEHVCVWPFPKSLTLGPCSSRSSATHSTISSYRDETSNEDLTRVTPRMVS